MANALNIFYRLTTPEYLIITFFSFFSILFLINTDGLSISTSLTTFASLALIVLALNSFNQIYDLKSDRVNKPNRPLIKKEISIKGVFLLSYTLFFISIILSLLVNLNFFIIILSFIIVSVTYSAPPIRLKKFPLSGIFIGTYIYGIVPLLSALAISQNANVIYAAIFGLFFILLAFSASSIKDLEDLEGDKKMKIISLPLLIGPKNSKCLVFSLFSFTWIYLLFSILLAIIPPKFLYSLIVYLIILLLISQLLFNHKKGDETTQSKYLTAIMILVAIMEVFLVINARLIS